MSPMVPDDATFNSQDNQQYGRPEKYPWDEWMNGAKWELIAGDDFDGTADSFRVLAHRKAREHGLKVKTSINRKDKRRIFVKFFEP